jgi:hypothetical protein
MVEKGSAFALPIKPDRWFERESWYCQVNWRGATMGKRTHAPLRINVTDFRPISSSTGCGCLSDSIVVTAVLKICRHSGELTSVVSRPGCGVINFVPLCTTITARPSRLRRYVFINEVLKTLGLRGPLTRRRWRSRR